MYQTGDSIKNTLDQIDRRDLVLPAIQREFVWQPEQIYRLFDSLMQGYPFGTFLFWRVNPENSGGFKFFDFVREYHQRDKPHCPPAPPIVNRKVTAVLDGQQRLTALNIGLKGSLARKLPRLWWTSPNAFPEKRLYLNLLWQADPDDADALNYRFEFLTGPEATARGEGVCWYLVPAVMSLPEDAADAITKIDEWLDEHLPEESAHARQTLIKLHQVVHGQGLITYYEELDQELITALKIFTRMNDSGTPLSHSDLLLSTVVAQWTTHEDARKEINGLVDELNQIGRGFVFSKDLVLRAGLMLSDIGRVGFKVDNFNRTNMETFESKWDDIKRALSLTVQLVSSFGFNGHNLTAPNSTLPIAYYLFRKDPGQTYLTHNSFAEDRENIREWLVRSLLKRGTGSSESLLTELRRIIREHGAVTFPASEIYKALAARGRELVFNDEEIEGLGDMTYGDRRTFALLSMLFPFVGLWDLHHLDHVFPSARFTRRQLLNAGVPEDDVDSFIERRDRLANLQLLQGAMNVEKSAKMPAEWLTEAFPNPAAREGYANSHLLGTIPDSLSAFDTFYEARRERLKTRIGELLGRRSQS